MGSPRRQPQGYISPQGGIHPTLPVQTIPVQNTHSNKLLCRSSQEQLPVGGIASAVKQKCCRIGPKSTVPGFLQPVIPGTQAQQPVATYLGSEQTKHLKAQSFKMETLETIRTSLQTGEWVTSIDFKDAYFHIPINSQSRKYMRFHIQDKTYQFKPLPFGLSTAPMEFTVIAKEVKWLAMRGYKNPPVPRRLVGQSHIPPGLSSAHTNPIISLQGIGVASKRGEIRAGTQASFQFRRLPV